MSLDPRTPIDDLQRIAREFSKINDRLRRLETPSGTQRTRTVELLGELRSYAATGGFAMITGDGVTPAVTSPYTSTPSVTFTISRPMSVQISAVMPFEALIDTLGAGHRVHGQFLVAGVEQMTIIDFALSGARSEVKRAAYGAETIELAAGTHTVTTTALVGLDGTAAGTDTVVGDAITLTATVLGAAA